DLPGCVAGRSARQSLAGSAFPGRAWEREPRAPERLGVPRFSGPPYNAAWTNGSPPEKGLEDTPMRRIAIIHQKGGVGKTTTAVNLAAALAQAGKRVCVLDLDPQAHATTHLGVEPDGTAPSMYDVLINSKPLAEVRRKVSDRLWLAGSDINLAA